MEQIALVGVPVVAFFLLTGGAFMTRPRSVGRTPYFPGGEGSIVRRQRSEIEDINVYFRRRKPNSVEAKPETEIEPDYLALSPSPSAKPGAGSPEPEAKEAAPLAPPAMSLPLRSQVTSADSRADRLIRQVRSEVEALKKTLETLPLDHEEMLAVDLPALLAYPEQALTLPPTTLVRALVTLGEENARLEAKHARQREKATKLNRKLRELQRDDAGRRARIESFEEVLAALHANLEDLRYERDHLRVGAPPAPQALRTAPGQLPQASAGGRD
ncbi:MAG: hypothetical protein ABIP13_06650 [Tepidiformaceae bacterium]